MRRLLLFVTLLTLVGLSTAFAASLDVSSEDIATFDTGVSISVPTTAPPGPTPFPPALYVRGPQTAATGFIELARPPTKDQPQTDTLELDTTPPPSPPAPDTRLKDQSNASMFRSWISPTAPVGGYLLRGDVTLLISMQNGGGQPPKGVNVEDRMTAGLFICPAPTPPTPPSTLPPPTGVTTGCTEIVQALGHSTGGVDVEVPFGPVDATIPAGSQLVLKILNLNKASNGTVVSDESWVVSWGFLESRPSQLVITP